MGEMACVRAGLRWCEVGDSMGDGMGWEMAGAGERVSDSLLNCADTLPASSMGMGG